MPKEVPEKDLCASYSKTIIARSKNSPKSRPKTRPPYAKISIESVPRIPRQSPLGGADGVRVRGGGGADEGDRGGHRESGQGRHDGEEQRCGRG